jgi:hypothetical protein
MAILADSKVTSSSELQALQEAARARGVEVSMHRVASTEEITATITSSARASTVGGMVSPCSLAIGYGCEHIVVSRSARQNRNPDLSRGRAGAG